MRSISVCLYLLFAKIALVAAQQSNSTGNGTVSVPTPTLSPTITRPPFTWEPTTTFPPTLTPTRAPIPAPVPDRVCYTNLTEIDDKNKLKNPFVVETIVLCPNTVFKMGVYGPDGDIVDGYDPLQPRSNTIYTCGEDGKSSNNCTLDGGGYHIYHSFVTYNRENKVGVVLKGITFNDSIEGGVILVAPGDITFIDCIFSNHKSTGVAQILYAFKNTRRLSQISAMPNEAQRIYHQKRYYSDILKDPVALKEYMENARETYDRALQVGGDVIQVQTVTFEDCLFIGNSVGPEGVLTQDGVIFVASPSNVVILKNCTFQDNDYGSPVNGANGYALSAVAGAPITITDTCFIDNNFVGDGAVLTESIDTFTQSNVYGTSDIGLKCPFAMVGGECIEYSSTSCGGNESSPADSPVITPDDDKNQTSTSGTSSVVLGFSFVGTVMVLLL